MEKRRGASISVKMIATSTLLILMIVALFGILNIVNTSRVFDEQAQRQRDAFVTSLQKRGAVQTKDLVQASRNAILRIGLRTTLQQLRARDRRGGPGGRLRLRRRQGRASCSRTRTRAMLGKPMTDPHGQGDAGGQGRRSTQAK